MLAHKTHPIHPIGHSVPLPVYSSASSQPLENKKEKKKEVHSLRDVSCSHGAELPHPGVVLGQVGGGHGLGDLLEREREVLHGDGHLQLVLGEGADLLGTQALDAPSHGHHGRVPGWGGGGGVEETLIPLWQ